MGKVGLCGNALFPALLATPPPDLVILSSCRNFLKQAFKPAETICWAGVLRDVYRTVLNAGKYVRQPSYGIDLPQAAYSRASFNCSTPSKSSFSCAGSEEINRSDLRPNTFGATNIFAGLMKSKYSLRRVAL